MGQNDQNGWPRGLREEGQSLIHKAKEGDGEALSLLVGEHLGLVRSCVRRFRGRGVEEEDLFQIGSLGLVKAIKRFDEAMGLQFSTYAVPVILGEIRRYFRDDGWIKVSRSVKDTARHLREAEEKLSGTTGRTPSLSEVAKTLGISAEEAAFAASTLAPAHSLDECVHDGGSSPILLKDVIPGRENEEEEALNRVMVTAALGTLEKKEQMLISLRYYQGKTQSETALVLGVSQVQVSRMEKRILAGMRKGMEKENL